MSIVILAVIVWRVIVPQYGAAVDALNSLEHVSLALVLTAAGLEVASLLANSALTAAVLGRGRPRYLTLLRIDLTNLGVSHVVPGGGIAAAAVRYRLLGLAGVRPADALTAAAIQTTGANLVLGLLFALGLIVSLASLSDNAYYLVAASVVLGLLIIAGVAGWVLTRRTDEAAGIAQRIARRIPLVTQERAESFVRTLSAHIRELLTDRRRTVIALGFATANWLLDAAALWLILAAFGFTANIGGLLTVYGLGSILALLPLTPGGIGVVEGVMVPAMVALGATHSAALLGVIGWRLLQFWLPIPVALLAYVSLRLGVLRGRHHAEAGPSALPPPA